MDKTVLTSSGQVPPTSMHNGQAVMRIESESPGPARDLDNNVMSSTGPESSNSEISSLSPNSSNGSSTEGRRPPQQYTRAWRAEILRKLKRELVRYRTFQSWSNELQDPRILSKAGFFYFNDGDKVQCAFCLGIVGHWEESDDPFIEHRRHFPRCPFILGLPVGNVPLNGSNSQERHVIPRIGGGFDVPGIRQEVRANAEPEGGTGLSKQVVVNRGCSWEELGIQPHSSPAIPAFLTLDSRLKTFQTWPRGLPQKPLDLAEAGFYYSGVSDEVKCFHCDGGLRGWGPIDNPWVEHAKWFHHCHHILLIRGKPFIDNVLKNATISMNAGKRTALVDKLLKEEPATTVLGMGWDIGDVRGALLEHVKKFQKGFERAEDLIAATNSLALERVPGVKEEKKERKDGNIDLLCKICMENIVSIVILPCGHLCSCAECASSLKNCPICRKPFKGFIRAFLS